MKPFHLFFLLSFLSFYSNLIAQETGYKQGYIITNENDTIKGFVKNRNFLPYAVLEKIKFKETEEGKSKRYSPEELKGYKFGEDVYVSKKTTEISGYNESFFVLKLLSGPLNCYKYEIVEQPGRSGFIILLEKEVDKSQFSIEDPMPNNFKKLLVEFLKDEPILSEKILNGEFKKTEILKIVEEYNYLKSPNK